MIISFFEEFPIKRNLDKLKLVKWQTKLYIAAKSFKEFNKIRLRIKNKYVKEIIYWPILDKKEGYWISPFSKRGALLRIFNEVHDKDVSVMVDCELPTTKNLFLYITQFFNFFKNRKLIRKFILSHKKVYTAEYYPKGKFNELIMDFLGIHFNSNIYNNKIIKMVYHSMHKFDRDFITEEIKSCKEEFGDKFIVGYGTIAKGISGNETILSLEQLREDLNIAKKTGIKEIIIFRLGGLNKEYCLALN